MPHRSNDVQQLIDAIGRNLHGDARVTEWLLLRHEDGTPCEVDLAIEATARDQPILIAIEYRDHARPADSAWIDQLASRYRGLPVRQLVAVAKAGFTPAARARAVTSRIRTLTFAQAVVCDWARVVDRVAGTVGSVIGADARHERRR